MISISPATFATADLTSNVAITETEWIAGTYDLGDQRYVGINLYQVTADPNTTDEPTAGAAKTTPTWVLIGQINRWRMFNNVLHQPTEQTGGPITVEIEVASIVNAIAVLKCSATEATVVITDPNEGEVYRRVVSLVDNSMISDWYAWFFNSIKRRTEFVLTDLPSYAGATISLTLDAGDEDTACGAFIVGNQSLLGSTLLEYDVRSRFFSRRERSVFGDFLNLIGRPTAREASFDVLMNADAVAGVLTLLESRDVLPTVFIGDEAYEQSIVFGFPDEPEAQQITPLYSKMKLTVLGIT